MRGIVLLLCLVGLSVPSAASAQEGAGASPPIIDRIVIRTHNVFDSSEATRNFLFRLANSLRITTRQSVVRHELLFREGEPYDSAKVAETLRNLRGRGLFRDVRIEPMASDSGNQVDVLVETFDGWSTQLVMNASFTAGEFSWALGGRETNFLGAGAEAGVVYRDVPDRTALQLNGALRRIRGSRFEAGGFWDNLSDGDFGSWFAGAPFRALGDRHGFLLQGSAGLQRVLQFRDGDSLETYRRRLFVQRAEVAVAPVAGSDGFLRVGVGGQVRREEFLLYSQPGSLVPDTVTGTVGVFADFLRPRFKVVRNYSGFVRDEDIDLSTRVTTALWLAPRAFGYEEDGIGPSVRVQTGLSAGKNFVKLVGWANGLYTSSGLDSGQVGVSLTAASQVIRKNATVIHFEWATRRGVPPGFEYDLGHGQGPRAFGPHAFTGETTVWGSLEQRAFLIDQFVGLFGIGFAAFVDYGGAWYRDQPRRLGGDVGLGLRLGSTRSSGQNVGRIDVGYRFGEGWQGNRLAVSFGSGFAF
jgi:hypothetical protein